LTGRTGFPLDQARRARATALQWLWRKSMWWGAITPGTPAARKFGAFGDGSWIAWPPTTIYNEQYIRIGREVRIAPQVTLSVGMVPGQEMVSDPVVTIGDRTLIGKGSGIVAHLSVTIGADVFTGHHVYITDQNHAYEDRSLPIGQQMAPEDPVVIGDGSWLGHGSLVLPGVTVGRHVVVAGGSVVTKDVPDYTVVAGAPARVLRRWDENASDWESVRGDAAR
jgi:acetyltransferase-like isoleucine patch superfamily enzyme